MLGQDPHTHNLCMVHTVVANAAATAWQSWDKYMTKRPDVRKPVAEELKLFG